MKHYFKQYREPSKTVNIVFKILHLFLGLYFGFFKYKSPKIRIAAKCFCLLQSSIVSIVVLNSAFVSGNFWYMFWLILLLAQYLIYVIILIFVPSDVTLSRFQSAIKLIDIKLHADKAHLAVETRRKWSFLFIFSYRAIILIFCFTVLDSCAKSNWVVVVIFLILISFDTISFAIIFVFYAIQYRLFVFVSTLKTTNNQSLSYFHHLYKLIVDVTEKFKRAHDLLFLTALLFNIPSVMFSIYHFVWIMQQTNDLTNMLPMIIGSVAVTVALLIALGPAIVAGKLSAEVEKIKIILLDKLLLEKDESRCSEIESFIRYIEARPMKFTVCTLIPFNVKLLGMVFNFCVTYLIVIIQFSHMY